MLRTTLALLTLLSGVAAIGLTPTSAHATLIEQDLNAIGDGLITLDTSTGFEWLDVTATQGLSYDDTLLTPFVTDQGFRFADTNELTALYASFGITDLTGASTVDNFPGAFDIIALMGCTASPAQCASFQFFQFGHAELLPGDPLQPFAVAVAKVIAGLGDRGSADIGLFNDSKQDGTDDRGSYLVRGAPVQVAEPATVVLFGLGLAGLGFMGRRRKAA